MIMKISKLIVILTLAFGFMMAGCSDSEDSKNDKSKDDDKKAQVEDDDKSEEDETQKEESFSSGSDEAKMADLACESIKLEKELKESVGDQDKIDELEKKANELEIEMDELGSKLEEKYANDKEAEKAAQKKFLKTLMNCDALAEQEKAMFKSQIEMLEQLEETN